MVENSIYAGATNITVEIKKGGISYIKVTDNGSFVEKYNRVVDLSEASIKLLGKKDLLNVKIYTQ